MLQSNNHGAVHSAVSTVMTRLRDQTADLHALAERTPFQQAFVRGEITLAEYTRWLSQMYVLHRALDEHLRRAAEAVEAIRRVVTPEQYQEPYLREDLGSFGVEIGSITPMKSTAAFVARLGGLAATSPLDLLGIHYVLEGSKNGNRFIVRAVRKTLGLTPGRGDRYLDTYGEAQPAKWAAFKDAMNDHAFTSEQIDRLVAAARECFQAVMNLSSELRP